jgi:hypothetical protein
MVTIKRGLPCSARWSVKIFLNFVLGPQNMTGVEITGKAYGAPMLQAVPGVKRGLRRRSWNGMASLDSQLSHFNLGFQDAGSRLCDDLLPIR